ncbi:MAG: NUDIX domain-containing protein [Candidatus Diapherotrites archaeon]|nr:NUDIX domain-containing protein [Candidatus Diapherotrites archaeon]
MARGAVASIVFARENGKIYALSVQRANEKLWNRQLIFGGAGKVKTGETRKHALEREIREELHITNGQMLKITPIGKAGAKRPEHYNFKGSFYLVEVPMETLRSVARRINKNPREFGEVRSARINRIPTLGKKPGIVQPHYRDMLPAIKDRLKREKRRRK